MKNKSNLFPLVYALLIFILASCSGEPDSYLSGYEPGPEPTWQFEQDTRVIGKVIPSHSLELSFPVSGQIVEKLVNEGDIVSRGDLIASFDTRLLEKEIAEAESHLQVAKANYDRVLIGASRIDLILAEKDLTAAQALTPLSTPEATLQAVSIAAAQAQLDYLETLPLAEDIALAQSEVDRAQAGVDSVKELLEKTTLVSPINGTVLVVFFQSHDYVDVGEPIVRISDLDELSVEVWLDEVDAANISIGDVATVTFETLPGISTQAEVTWFTPNLNNLESRDFKVSLRLLEVPEDLRWGVTAEVSFQK